MPDPVIVPLDGSATAECALPVAAAIARRTGAPLHLVRVHVPNAQDHPGFPAGWPPAHRDDAWRKAFAATYLGEVAQRVMDAGAQGSVVTAILDPPVERALVAYARRAGGLVVMGLRGRHHDGTGGIGTVADRVARWSGLPVILVPATGVLTASSHADWPCARIVLGEPGAAGSVVAPAVALARAFGSRISVVAAQSEPPRLAVDRAMAFRPLARAEPSWAAQGEEACAWLRTEGVSADLRRLTGAADGAAIVALAGTLEADLVAMDVVARADGGVLRYDSPISATLRRTTVPILVSCSKPRVSGPRDRGRVLGSLTPAPVA